MDMEGGNKNVPQVENVDIETKIVFAFTGFALVIGGVNALLGLSGREGALLALLFFYVSYKVITNIWNLEETSFDASAWSLIKTGFIPYWFLLMVFWTFIHTLQF